MQKIFFPYHIISLALFLLILPQVRNPVREKAQNVKVLDGDTLELKVRGKIYRVRLLGIDAPELKQTDLSKKIYLGELAKSFLKSQVEGLELELVLRGQDIYHRYLGLVYQKGKYQSLNSLLIQSGMAIYYPQSSFQSWHERAQFLWTQVEAMMKKNGCWKYRFFSPAYYRHRQ